MTLRIPHRAVALFLFAGVMSAANSELVNLLMPNAAVVAGVNVGRAKSTQFGQFVLAQVAADHKDDPMIAKAGFNPATDLNEVLAGTSGLPGVQSLILASGTFYPQLVSAAAQAAGATVADYKGVPIFTVGKRAASLAFLGTSIAIIGDLVSVQGAIDRRTATSPAINSSLASQIQQLSESMDAWAISTVPVSKFANLNLPDQQLNALLNSGLLQSIQQTSGGVSLGSSIQLSAQAVTNSSQNATALADVVRFLANMLQADAPSSASAVIASLVQTLTVQTDGNTVNITASIPESQIESLVRAEHQKP